MVYVMNMHCLYTHTWFIRLVSLKKLITHFPLIHLHVVYSGVLCCAVLYRWVVSFFRGIFITGVPIFIRQNCLDCNGKTVDIKDIATEILIEIRRSPSTYPQAPQTGLETAREMLHDLKNTRVV